MNSGYELVEEESKEELTVKVNTYLIKDWKCQGGICVDTFTNETTRGLAVCTTYYQAMVKAVSDE